MKKRNHLLQNKTEKMHLQLLKSNYVLGTSKRPSKPSFNHQCLWWLFSSFCLVSDHKYIAPIFCAFRDKKWYEEWPDLQTPSFTPTRQIWWWMGHLIAHKKCVSRTPWPFFHRHEKKWSTDRHYLFQETTTSLSHNPLKNLFIPSRASEGRSFRLTCQLQDLLLSLMGIKVCSKV